MLSQHGNMTESTEPEVKLADLRAAKTDPLRFFWLIRPLTSSVQSELGLPHKE